MMKFGISLFFTEYSMKPAGLAQELEARGFESVWSGEHSHMPAAMKTPFPGEGGIKRHYYDVMDPFVTLTAAAMATKTLKIGTGVCLIAQRDPIQTAKLVASIDQVSSGRFLFGIGDGWNQEEIEKHGTEFKTRHKRARETVEAMKRIWTQTQAEYHGEFVSFDPIMTWPKPVQKPHVPILVGGAFPYAARRAVRYGDGWIPTTGTAAKADEILGLLPKFHAMLKEAGRDPASCPVSLSTAPADLDLWKRARDKGVVRINVGLQAASTEQAMPILDQWAALMAKL